MAAKKFYAVKKGKTPGIYTDWDSCKAAVDGYPGAEYKGFPTLMQAKEFLGVTDEAISHEKQELPAEGCVLAYVDGSYEDSIRKYAFGCVFLLPTGEIYTAYGNGDNEMSLQQRNVSGEMLGAMYATQCAIYNGYARIELRYDYEGVEKWVTGAWKSKTDLTQKYATYMREKSKVIGMKFTKVPAHSNVKFNEVADGLAKKGLTEGRGVPKPCSFQEMEPLGEEWN